MLNDIFLEQVLMKGQVPSSSANDTAHEDMINVCFDRETIKFS